jgi:hypothetical protein
LLARGEEQSRRHTGDEGPEEGFQPEAAEEEEEAPVDRGRIEELFADAARDRSKAFEL